MCSGCKMTISGILVVALLFCEVLGGVEQNVENARQKHDHLQEEILAAMKDSGVLKEWKEKLDDMLYQENEVDVNNPPKEQKKSVINKMEREMLTSFIEEYKTDQQLTVPTDLILEVVERVQKTPKPNLPQIFVQLGPVINVLAAISQKTSDVRKIVDRQAPIFDSPAKPKDILHTLAENLKSELVRLTLDSKPTLILKNCQSRHPANTVQIDTRHPCEATEGLLVLFYSFLC